MLLTFDGFSRSGGNSYSYSVTKDDKLPDPPAAGTEGNHLPVLATYT